MTPLEIFEYGEGPPVILCHGAASHALQWRVLIEDLKSSHHLIAINQYGYGQSPSWSLERSMTLEDQIIPVLHLIHSLKDPVHLIGHSHGATLVALIATHIPDRVQSLSLYEPNTFCILDPQTDQEAYQDTCEAFKSFHDESSNQSRFPILAQQLLDFWLGEGSWSQVSSRHKSQLISSMPSTLREVRAVIHDSFPLAALRPMASRSLLMFDPHTPPSAIRVIKKYREVLEGGRVHMFPRLGHLAPIRSPDQVNPVICEHIRRCFDEMS